MRSFMVSLFFAPLRFLRPFWFTSSNGMATKNAKRRKKQREETFFSRRVVMPDVTQLEDAIFHGFPFFRSFAFFAAILVHFVKRNGHKERKKTQKAKRGEFLFKAGGDARRHTVGRVYLSGFPFFALLCVFCGHPGSLRQTEWPQRTQKDAKSKESRVSFQGGW